MKQTEGFTVQRRIEKKIGRDCKANGRIVSQTEEFYGRKKDWKANVRIAKKTEGLLAKKKEFKVKRKIVKQTEEC